MVLDVTRGAKVTLDEETILPRLAKIGTSAASGLIRYLDRRPEYLFAVAEYLAYRADAETHLLSKLRTEDEALDQLAELGEAEVARYGTKSADHYQSSKAMVATVETLTKLTIASLEVNADINPQSRAVIIGDRYLWVSPRRLDGALPSLVNPVGLWEIKEYWGKKDGGSKMSDAIYECQLVGQELRAFEDLHGIGARHYVILDGRDQWLVRRADLRRAIDLLSQGVVDELIVGREVIEEWPRIIQELSART
jgi:hypothetical protein